MEPESCLMPYSRLRRVLSRNYLIFVVVLCSLAAYLCYVLLANRASMERGNKLVTETYQVINIAEQTMALVEGMLAAQRGYILSGNGQFLDKYEAKKNTVSEHLATLTALTSRNQAQQSRLDEARNYFVMFSNQLEERAARFTPKSTVELANNVAVIDKLRDNLHRISDSILAEEHMLLDRRIRSLEQEKRNYVDTLLLAIVMGTVLLLVFNAFLLSAHQGRTQAETSLRNSEKRFALAVEGTQDGIFDWDLQNKTLYCSDQFFRMLGYDARRGFDIPAFMELVHPEDRPKAWGSVEALSSHGRPEYNQEFRMLHQSGRWLWIQAQGKILYDRYYRPLRIVGAHTDISQLVRANEKLLAEKELAQKANRAKSEFLAHMSHEIRTPLTAISGIAEILERQSHSFNERQQKMVHTLSLSAASLKDLINDVLDFSKIESGEVELQPQLFALDELFEEIVSMMAVRANEKGISFLCDYSSVKGLDYYGDRGRIRQICVNLISNAIKFTDAGKVTITTSQEERDGGPYLRVEVADTGIGISADDFEMIFERFKQVNSSESRKYGGTGLGLAISRNLATLMGGLITVSSSPGSGSTFTLLLPMGPVQATPAAAYDTTPSADVRDLIRTAVTEETRVLLVEDYSGNIVLVGYLLEELGIPYDVATTGSMAVSLWRNQPYDLILMDIQMPEMDGYEATRIIRREEQQLGRAYTPIVAMTAHALMGDKDQCIQAGMDAYLSKPIVESELKRLLLTYLRRAKQNQQQFA